tara:strand:- start:8557 stop:9174 length:618 start_codon:yes stop_codon:yes gene_type:complete
MRIKSYYSANEIVNNLYTTGQELMTTDNVEYVGLYHKYTTGEIYSQPTWNKNKSVKLIKYKEQPESVIEYNKISDIEIDYKSFNTYNVAITKENINNGYVDRFIIKRSNDNIFYEVNSDTYDMYTREDIDPVLYLAVKFKWYITGNINDVIQGNILIPGVKSNNYKELQTAEKTVPNITSYLTNLLQHYVDNDNVTPKDINGLDS